MPKKQKNKSAIARQCLRLRGVVQGVGMRPFVYRLAVEEKLAGFVYNDGHGVIVEVEGPQKTLDRFRERLVHELPPAAHLDELAITNIKPLGLPRFQIVDSPEDESKFTRLSPDLATCSDCLTELNDPKDRRFHYPFTNCTNCGPRLTIIQDVPYDRPRTTMAGFAMCPACRKEYRDPANRRFHAQPNACAVCGPQIFIIRQDSVSPHLRAEEALQHASRALQQGKIVGIKGIGGMHLACNAANPQAVARLRSRKFREEKPFALMVRDLEHARRLADVNQIEADLMSSVARPIVILDAKPGAKIAPSISPDLDTLGLMLPYTPLHHLLLEASGLDLVMTSGNLSEEPIAFGDDEIIPRLKGIADLFLLHDRPIHLRCDDSVVRVVNGRRLMLRRSRGFVPDPIRLPRPLQRPILSCGAELKSTFCLGREEHIILSHHIGDLENLATLEAFEHGIEHFQCLFYIQPEEIACDRHPDYLSSQYAQKRGLPLLEVQHHHAHALACLAETGDFSPALAWALDGIGLGMDGMLWGGECLQVEGLNCRPLARLRPIPLPGGARAIREPWRIAVAALLTNSPREGLRTAETIFPHHPVQSIAQMLEKGINCPLSSGAGRLFDAVAALAGVRDVIAYEGQAAILLEVLAQRERQGCSESLEGIPIYRMDVQDGAEDAPLLLDWGEMIKEISKARLQGISPGEIGARFHATMVHYLLQTSLALREKTGLRRMVLSGGVFQNRLLLSHLWRELERAGFEVLVPAQAPVNDGGIALGQAAALWLRQRGTELSD
jgi:hydrogenase maturation protein HypF